MNVNNGMKRMSGTFLYLTWYPHSPASKSGFQKLFKSQHFSKNDYTIRASQFFQIAKQIEGDVVEVIWVGCSQILFVQAYFWCFNLQYCSM